MKYSPIALLMGDRVHFRYGNKGKWSIGEYFTSMPAELCIVEDRLQYLDIGMFFVSVQLLSWPYMTPLHILCEVQSCTATIDLPLLILV